jgi:hypothetical protein
MNKKLSLVLVLTFIFGSFIAEARRGSGKKRRQANREFRQSIKGMSKSDKQASRQVRKKNFRSKKIQRFESQGKDTSRLQKRFVENDNRRKEFRESIQGMSKRDKKSARRGFRKDNRTRRHDNKLQRLTKNGKDTSRLEKRSAHRNDKRSFGLSKKSKHTTRRARRGAAPLNNSRPQVKHSKQFQHIRRAAPQKIEVAPPQDGMGKLAY